MLERESKKIQTSRECVRLTQLRLLKSEKRAFGAALMKTLQMPSDTETATLHSENMYRPLESQHGGSFPSVLIYLGG